MAAVLRDVRYLVRDSVRGLLRGIDPGLALVLLMLAGLGLVMMTSASVTLGERLVDNPLYHFDRQLATFIVGLVLVLVLVQVPLRFWQHSGQWWLLLGAVLLLALLLPGVGRTVNGSTRWLPLGPVSLQVSEFVKVFALVYFAAYLNRRRVALGESFFALFLPCAMLAAICTLIVMQPDFGTAVVLFAAVMGMVFLGGVPPLRFFLWVVCLGGSVFAVLAVSSPYRLQRLNTFMDPWSDPFNHGFQLTQALIAYGRGGFWGQGLGGGMQKLFYLPEAHTDFVNAVIAEELGLPGSVLVIVLFAVLVWKCFRLARVAMAGGYVYAAYIAWGVGLFTGLQAIFNIGVSMGMLPTKGITLPYISYGNNSLLAHCLFAGLLLRVARETAFAARGNAHG